MTPLHLAAAAILLAATALPASAAAPWTGQREPVDPRNPHGMYSAASEAHCRAFSAYLDKIHPRPPIHLGCHHVAY